MTDRFDELQDGRRLTIKRADGGLLLTIATMHRMETVPLTEGRTDDLARWLGGDGVQAERDEWKALAHSTEVTLKQQQGASTDQIAEANRTGQAMGAAAESERFHAAWGMAKGRSDYDKDAWKMVQAAMEKVPFDRLVALARTVEPNPVAAQLERLRAMPDGHVGAPALPEGARCTKLDIEHGWDDDGHGFVTVSGKYAVDSGVPHLDVMDGLRAVLSKEARTVEPRDTEPPRREAVVGKPEPEGLDCGKPVMMGHGNDYQCEREPGHNGRCGESWEGQELGERALAAEAVGKPSTWEEAEAGEGGAEFEAFVTWWADYKTGIAFSPEEQDAAWEAWSERADRGTPTPEPWTEADRDVLQAVAHRLAGQESWTLSDDALRLAVLDIERRMHAGTPAPEPPAPDGWSDIPTELTGSTRGCEHKDSGRRAWVDNDGLRCMDEMGDDEPCPVDVALWLLAGHGTPGSTEL